jgi:hypothetical protein
MGRQSNGRLLALPTKMKVNGSGKHSRLLRYITSYSCEKFYSTGPKVVENLS